MLVRSEKTKIKQAEILRYSYPTLDIKQLVVLKHCSCQSIQEVTFPSKVNGEKAYNAC